ncbi:MAG TPA: universal stress protein [Candidatus Krumholzibacteria bacterium]|nr:universal stress protein [Candidatus Krumholzibacteria bacterium]
MLHADRILVYTRGRSADDPAVSRAVALAKQSGALISIIDVFDGLPPEFGPLQFSLPLTDACEEAERERRSELLRTAAVLREDGVHVECDVRWGHPSIEIVQEAIRRRYGLVILGDDRRHGVAATTRAVIRHCPCPVWVVKPAPHLAPLRVLAAVDPVGSSGGSFDRAVLESAAAVANALRAELYVVHAWQPLHAEFDWLPANFQEFSGKKDVRAQTAARHTLAVENLVRSVVSHLPSDACHLREGSAADTILAVAHDLGADLLVIGTARSALYAHLLLGKTAEAVIEQVPISVLTIKPAGFVSLLS